MFAKLIRWSSVGLLAIGTFSQAADAQAGFVITSGFAPPASIVVSPTVVVPAGPANFVHGYQVLFRPRPGLPWQVYGAYAHHRTSHEVARGLHHQGFQTRVVRF